jgi:hydrogenase nickel incorporation protein HypB
MRNEQPRESAIADRRSVVVRQGLLVKNDAQAMRNRELFRVRGVLAINLLSSPGSGKTALLERTLTDLAPDLPTGVVVGDLATDNDARRLRRPGVEVVQITTGNVCHLEAAMVERACAQMDLDRISLLFIENVGNLVCPASYDLGEELRVVLLSVTEGEDKPLKYPKMFKLADLVVVTKIDLAPFVDFDRDAVLRNIAEVAPQAAVLEVSARTGQGLEGWYAYLKGDGHRNSR